LQKKSGLGIAFGLVLINHFIIFKIQHMKKISGVMAAFLMSTACFAQWQGSNGNNNNTYQGTSLIVSSLGQKQFTVVVDNYTNYQNTGSNNVYISNLGAGNHQVMIYEYRTNIFGKQRQVLVYNSTVYLRQGYETTISMNAFGQANVSERQIYSGNSNGGYENNNGGYGNNGDGRGYGRHKTKRERKCGNGEGGNRHWEKREEADND
jgi:hypothetical protein